MSLHAHDFILAVIGQWIYIQRNTKLWSEKCYHTTLSYANQKFNFCVYIFKRCWLLLLSPFLHSLYRLTKWLILTLPMWKYNNKNVTEETRKRKRDYCRGKSPKNMIQSKNIVIYVFFIFHTASNVLFYFSLFSLFLANFVNEMLIMKWHKIAWIVCHVDVEYYCDFFLHYKHKHTHRDTSRHIHEKYTIFPFCRSELFPEFLMFFAIFLYNSCFFIAHFLLTRRRSIYYDMRFEKWNFKKRENYERERERKR